MTIMRGAVAATALAGLLSLGLGGCSDSTDTTAVDKAAATTAGQAPPDDAQTALAGAATALQSGNYTFVVASPTVTAEGVVHLPSESAKLTIDSGNRHYELVLAEPDRWVRLTDGDAGQSPLDPQASAGTWFHVDSSEVEKGGDLDIDLTDPDLIGLNARFAAATDVRGDRRTVTGTIDGTKVKASHGLLDDQAIKQMGANPSALSFTANLDGKGRLAELDIAASAGRWVCTVSGYGEQKPQTKPAGPSTDLPESGYAKLNG
jgi:hypothetical protein